MFLITDVQRKAPAVVNLRRQVAKIVGVPVENIEATQVLRYDPGQFYHAHTDWFDSSLTMHLKRGGQRIATALTWLSHVSDGGETTFPRLKLSIKPEMGNAIIWWNVDSQGNGDQRALHEGTPPRTGTKWVAVLWIREGVFK
eukprot:TRINITY_DN5623_c1_g1_i2.p1 TRINITY_DN5623_c1_g1~~TRINITY_DN5623_c1_g1_i2.p1  ORF type:complete len:142 (-),score=12.77 TRINITY_DN5623_c1_g1_i2:5-430(-)